MNATFHPGLLLLAMAALAAPSAGARVISDIAAPEHRREVVATAEKLARAAEPAPVAADLASPFNPPGFEDKKTPARDVGAPADSKPAAPATDRDVLEAVAAKIPTTGTIILGGTPLLVSGTNRIEVGSHFTVVYGGQEYELELTAIDRTTFTVRYKGEEFTRPIKLGKSP